MAATDAGLDHVVDQTHKVATNLAASEQSAEGLGNMFKQAALTFVGIDMVRKAVVDIVERTTTWQSLSQAVSKENLSRAGLLKREMDLNNEKHFLTLKSATAAGIEGEFQKARCIGSSWGVFLRPNRPPNSPPTSAPTGPPTRKPSPAPIPAYSLCSPLAPSRPAR